MRELYTYLRGRYITSRKSSDGRNESSAIDYLFGDGVYDDFDELLNNEGMKILKHEISHAYDEISGLGVYYQGNKKWSSRNHELDADMSAFTSELIDSYNDYVEYGKLVGNNISFESFWPNTREGWDSIIYGLGIDMSRWYKISPEFSKKVTNRFARIRNKLMSRYD